MRVSRPWYLGTLSGGFILAAAISGEEDIDVAATPECFIDASVGVPAVSRCFSAVIASVGFGDILISTTPETGDVVARPEEFGVFGSPLGPRRAVTPGSSHVAVSSICLEDPLTSLDGFGLAVSCIPGNLAKLAIPADFDVVGDLSGDSDILSSVEEVLEVAPLDFIVVGVLSGDGDTLSSVVKVHPFKYSSTQFITVSSPVVFTSTMIDTVSSWSPPPSLGLAPPSCALLSSFPVPSRQSMALGLNGYTPHLLNPELIVDGVIVLDQA